AVLGQAFDRRDALVGDGGDGQHAGAGGHAVQVHGAGAALGDAAAELRAGESQRVAQHPEERCVGGDVDRFTLAVDGEGNRGHEEVSSACGNAETRAWASREREGGMFGDLIRNGGAERATGIVWAVSFFRRRGLPVPRPFIYRVRDRGPHRSLGGWLAVILSERAERAGAKDLLEWPPPSGGHGAAV